MNEHLCQLEPSIVWRHFQTLCNTPRPSYHEAQLRDLLIQWAEDKNLESYVDTAGNLLIRKPATPGMEDRQGVVLQGHLDMVAQKNAQTQHDFTKDPILTRVEDGWLYAQGTTLGADNGIGVAAALAVLESNDIAHGPIEALFTIEEESSLRGALQLESGILKGRLLLNLDSEDRGDVYIGCAGGADVNVSRTFEAHAILDNEVSYEVRVSGLRGGHSGLDINKGRASANVILVRLLSLLSQSMNYSLASFSGGTLRNAIAREATASISMDKNLVDTFKDFVKHFTSSVLAEFASVEQNLTIEIVPVQLATSLGEQDTCRLINAMTCAPHGVHRMSDALPGVTETSCNFGVMNLLDGESGIKKFDACLLVRSLLDDAVAHHGNQVRSAFALIDAEVRVENGYPGWRPNPKAGLLKHFLDVHQDVMGQPANVKVIHAGLECGIIGAKYAGMEMVSFGPNIRGAHSPDERMEIDSVADFWRLLCALLATTPVQSQ